MSARAVAVGTPVVVSRVRQLDLERRRVRGRILRRFRLRWHTQHVAPGARTRSEILMLYR